MRNTTETWPGAITCCLCFYAVITCFPNIPVVVDINLLLHLHVLHLEVLGFPSSMHHCKHDRVRRCPAGEETKQNAKERIYTPQKQGSPKPTRTE